MPVAQCKTQALDIRMPGAKFRFDDRDLAAAAIDSCGSLRPFRFDLVECPAIAVENGAAAGEGLPALDNQLAYFGSISKP
jgi:hypothetical protein